MLIATGGFFHESNSFNPIVTGRDDFIIMEGGEVYGCGDAFPLAAGIVGYFLPKPDYELLPLVFARAVPNGEVSRELYEELKTGFFRLIPESARIDAFVLALHGSMRVKGIGSAETDLLQELKARYPNVPVFCGLDMHATVTAGMLACAQAFVGYKTAPHTDAFETGRHLARIADLCLRTGTKPCLGQARVNCLIAGEKSETDTEPMRSLIAVLRRLEEDPEVLAASLLLGFPWADAEENGVTALVVTTADQAKANALAREIADSFLARRRDFGFSMPALPPREALSLALSENVRPVFVSDSGDNPTAGSTADNTAIISLLGHELADRAKNKRVLVAGIFDPYAVEACLERFGSELTLPVGGNYDVRYCEPVTLTGTPMAQTYNFGPYCSGLVLFQTASFDLIVTSRHIGFTSPDIFSALGIDHRDYDVIVVKLGYLTPEFKAIAAKSYLALTQGCTDEVLSRLSYSSSFDLV
jgi:microcystin degradation protein MlrC